jgi:hypothetical protein
MVGLCFHFGGHPGCKPRIYGSPLTHSELPTQRKQSVTFAGWPQLVKPALADGHGKVLLFVSAVPGQHWSPLHIFPDPGQVTWAAREQTHFPLPSWHKPVLQAHLPSRSQTAFLLLSQASQLHVPPVSVSHEPSWLTKDCSFVSVDLNCNKCDNSSSRCWQLGPTQDSSAPLEATAESTMKRERTGTIEKGIREVRDTVVEL